LTHTVLTSSPYFIDSALNEIRRFHPDTSLVQHIGPGTLLLQTPEPFEKFTTPWRQHLPIYLHHLFPVHASITFDAYEPLSLVQLVRRVAPPHAAIQLRGTADVLPVTLASVQRSVCGNQAGQRVGTPRGSVVSIVVAPEPPGLRAYIGVSDAAHNVSPWAGGAMPITEAVCNRAGYKLIEALNAFEIRLRQGDHALDLGAAPGAWTTLLRQRGMRVTAIAPAPMYPWLTFDPGVTHEMMLAEDYLPRCKRNYDLIVNDMKLDPQDSARLMVDFAAHLRSGGITIMTLKLRTHNQQRVMDHAFRILRKAYRIIRVRQLVSNRHEVTLFLQRSK
jgi:23S rRNA (cytidine2498-2'-O)-methyltransferase